MDIDKAIEFLRTVDIDDLIRYRKEMKKQLQESISMVEKFKLEQKYYIVKSIWAARKNE